MGIYIGLSAGLVTLGGLVNISNCRLFFCSFSVCLPLPRSLARSLPPSLPPSIPPLPTPLPQSLRSLSDLPLIALQGAARRHQTGLRWLVALAHRPGSANGSAARRWQGYPRAGQAIAG